jgi:hypothetical protein
MSVLLLSSIEFTSAIIAKPKGRYISEAEYFTTRPNYT